MIKQFVPSEVCLKCKGCCRFREIDSVWAPCLMDEEIQDFLDKESLPPAFISMDKRIRPISNPLAQERPEEPGYTCAFFDIDKNMCKIYDERPFECRLYPFLLSMRNKKVLLTVDLNCPYAQEKLKTPEFKEYADYLTSYLNQPATIRLLTDNPHLLQAYEEVLDIAELKLPDEAQ
ncbi:MAG: YkgJ family cysteine cluster protein [Candidatus Omnitrophica bacterium]|nr:YkgJ family cysteine cluster protein [Candidatus Omnitrophota bacterium]MBU1869360.1 YkgJ family cysteine cluster protein [Candidatus Omnitrophota bacterium]